MIGCIARTNSLEEFSYRPDQTIINYEETQPPKLMQSPLRLDIERLSRLPTRLRFHKSEFRKFEAQHKKKQKPNKVHRYDLTFTSTLSSSFARYLADVNPLNLIKRPKKLRPPCNTPYPGVHIPDRRAARSLDVILLAQRLELIYRELYLPADIFHHLTDEEARGEASITGPPLSIKSSETDQAEQKHDDTADEEDTPFNYDLLADLDNSRGATTYRNLLVSPPNVDWIKSVEIREDNSLTYN